MPPKKQAAVEELATYDLKGLNRAELRAFAKTLESDIESLRHYCNFYQKAGDKLASFYEARVEELRGIEDTIRDKDRKMEEIRQKVAESLRENDDFDAYHAYVGERREERREVEVSGLLEEALDAHMKEVYTLRDAIDERERALAAETRKFEMSRRDDLENSTRETEEVGERETEMFERSVKAYKDMLVDAKRRHQTALEVIKDETIEAKRRGVSQFRDNCAAYKERLKKYYQDITREDLDTIRNLTVRVKELEDAIATTQNRLKKIQQQNEELKVYRGRAKPPSSNLKDIEAHRKILKARRSRNLKQIDDLKTENELLHKEIRTVTVQSDNLRRQFTRALFHLKQEVHGRVHRLRNRCDEDGVEALRVFDDLHEFAPASPGQPCLLDADSEEEEVDDDDVEV